ncbi:hypothetical protein VTO73DRAFT_9805 [Trametes versicolor]
MKSAPFCSRLARYCVYFKKLFADDTDDYEDRCAKVEGCPVYGQREPESDVAAVVKLRLEHARFDPAAPRSPPARLDILRLQHIRDAANMHIPLKSPSADFWAAGTFALSGPSGTYRRMHCHSGTTRGPLASGLGLSDRDSVLGQIRTTHGRGVLIADEMVSSHAERAGSFAFELLTDMCANYEWARRKHAAL